MDRLIDAAQLEGWIPLRLYWRDERPMVDWCYLGRRRFDASFFEQTVNKCMGLPFNLLFRHQTPIEVLGSLDQVRPGLMPIGFIFHMSRSGSTLISRLFASLPRNIIISEARPIDFTLRSHPRRVAVTDEQRISWLRWIVSALAQPRIGNEEHFLIKFDAWNIVQLPLIRQAFPAVPWIF